MKPKGQEKTDSNPDSFKVNLFDIPDEALSLYFEMASQQSAIDQEEIPERFGLSQVQSETLLKQLVSSGLVRRNPDKSYEAIAPIEAVVSVLLAVRNLLRQLRESFPEQLS